MLFRSTLCRDCDHALAVDPVAARGAKQPRCRGQRRCRTLPLSNVASPHSRRRELAKRAAQGGWSVRTLEAEIARGPQTRRRSSEPHPDQVAIAAKLHDLLARATGCEIQARPHRLGYRVILDQGAGQLLQTTGSDVPARPLARLVQDGPAHRTTTRKGRRRGRTLHPRCAKRGLVTPAPALFPCKSPQALCRTRTDDPFLTIEALALRKVAITRAFGWGRRWRKCPELAGVRQGRVPLVFHAI